MIRSFFRMFGSEEKAEEFNWDNKVVSYHVGCFCPPHIGHYDSIKNAINELNSDMKDEDKVKVILIRSVGSEEEKYSRHGINQQTSQKIWKSWSEHLSRDTGCHVIVIEDIYFIRTVPNTIKRLYTVRVIEGRGDEGKSKFEEGRKERHRKPFISDPSSYFPLVDRDKIFEAIFYRDVENGISATNFTKCLLEKDCTKFVPKSLSSSEKTEYIEFLKTYKLWVELEKVEKVEKIAFPTKGLSPTKGLPPTKGLKTSFWGT